MSLLQSCSIIMSWFRLGFRGLSPYSFGILFHHLFLVPARVPCLPSLLASCSIITSWFRLGFRGSSPYSSCILFRVPGIVSLVFWHSVPSTCPGRGLCSIVIFWLLLGPGWGSGVCLPSFLSFLFSGMGHPMNSLLRMNVVETWFVAVWGLWWCNFFFENDQYIGTRNATNHVGLWARHFWAPTTSFWRIGGRKRSSTYIATVKQLLQQQRHHQPSHTWRNGGHPDTARKASRREDLRLPVVQNNKVILWGHGSDIFRHARFIARTTPKMSNSCCSEKEKKLGGIPNSSIRVWILIFDYVDLF